MRLVRFPRPAPSRVSFVYYISGQVGGGKFAHIFIADIDLPLPQSASGVDLTPCYRLAPILDSCYPCRLEMFCKTKLVIAAAIMLVCTASARQLQQEPSGAAAAAPGCPMPDGEQVEFSQLRNSCDPSADLCSSCVCGIFETFEDAYAAGGAEFDPNDSSSLSSAVSRIASITALCLAAYGSDVASALGPNNTSIRQLGRCPFLTSPTIQAPECLQKLLYGLATANYTGTQSNSSGSSESVHVVLERDRSTADASNNSATVKATGGAANSSSSSSSTTGDATGPPADAVGAPQAGLPHTSPAASPRATASSAVDSGKPVASMALAAGCMLALLV